MEFDKNLKSTQRFGVFVKFKNHFARLLGKPDRLRTSEKILTLFTFAK